MFKDSNEHSSPIIFVHVETHMPHIHVRRFAFHADRDESERERMRISVWMREHMNKSHTLHTTSICVHNLLSIVRWILATQDMLRVHGSAIKENLLKIERERSDGRPPSSMRDDRRRDSHIRAYSVMPRRLESQPPTRCYRQHDFSRDASRNRYACLSRAFSRLGFSNFFYFIFFFCLFFTLRDEALRNLAERFFNF